MKQMRSRFRLITLLLVCGFLLVLVLCTGSALKTAGISLSSLASLQFPSASVSPSPAVSPDTAAGASPDTVPASALPEETPSGNMLPDADNPLDPEYNIFGL